MKTFTLFGSTQRPGSGGDWHALIQVEARDFASAAKKLRGRVRNEPDKEARWFTPSRTTYDIVSDVLIAMRRLRGENRLRAVREETSRLQDRYPCYFRLKLLPRLR